MAKFNFELDRDVKRRRSDGGKFLRIVLLFCLVAAVTAAVIYFILPKNAPEKTPDKTPDKSEQTEQKAEEGQDTTPASSDADTPAVKDDAGKGSENSENRDETPENPDTPQSEAGEGEKSQNGENSGEGDSPAASGGSAAKYDPASSELVKITESFRTSLQNGSWKNGRDVGVHSVKAGDRLERIARRCNNTWQFLKRANGISDVNKIKIGQKIHFLKADKWQITISRKKGELTLSRVLNGQSVPFALFPCRMKAGTGEADFVVGSRFSDPVYIDAHGRKFPAGSEGNPYGEGLITLQRSAAGNSRNSICIHGQGDAPAVEKSVASGGIVLHNQDMELLYLLVPEKTSVKIVE